MRWKRTLRGGCEVQVIEASLGETRRCIVAALYEAEEAGRGSVRVLGKKPMRALHISRGNYQPR
jgi:hypothetical protein